MRLSISFAAALVNVKQRIFLLFSNKSLNTLSIKILVLPVPADAFTHTEKLGLIAFNLIKNVKIV